jgi:hypothetical protein
MVFLKECVTMEKPPEYLLKSDGIPGVYGRLTSRHYELEEWKRKHIKTFDDAVEYMIKYLAHSGFAEQFNGETKEKQHEVIKTLFEWVEIKPDDHYTG